MHINIFYIYNISIWMHIYDTIEVHAHVTSTARFYFIARAAAALLLEHGTYANHQRHLAMSMYAVVKAPSLFSRRALLLLLHIILLKLHVLLTQLVPP